jgi:hypothetical protein
MLKICHSFYLDKGNKSSGGYIVYEIPPVTEFIKRHTTKKQGATADTQSIEYDIFLYINISLGNVL